MKKFFAMLLSLVMILSLSVPAFAAETDTVTSTEENKNTATHNVTASYTPSSTEDTTPTITGVSLSGTGVTYNDTTKTYTVAHDATDIVLTVTGTNFANLTSNYMVQFAVGFGSMLSDLVTGDTPNTVWTTVQADWFTDNNNFEIQYSTDGGTSWTGMGIYVTYDDGTEPEATPTITGVSLSGTGVTYDEATKTYTVAHNATGITVTVTGTNLQKATDDNVVWYASSDAAGLASYAPGAIADGTEISFTVLLSSFEDVTAAHEIKYSNDNEATWTNTGIYVQYQSEPISVDITWGAMSFTYDDTVAEGENGWTCTEGANKITVVNNSTVAVKAALAYAPANDYDWLGGHFELADGFSVTSHTIAASGSEDFYLILASDKPEAAFSGTVGTVTVTITESELPAEE